MSTENKYSFKKPTIKTPKYLTKGVMFNGKEFGPVGYLLYQSHYSLRLIFYKRILTIEQELHLLRYYRPLNMKMSFKDLMETNDRLETNIERIEYFKYWTKTNGVWIIDE